MIDIAIIEVKECLLSEQLTILHATILLLLVLVGLLWWKALCGPRGTAADPCAVPVLLHRMEGVVRPTTHRSPRRLIKLPSIIKSMKSLGITELLHKMMSKSTKHQSGKQVFAPPYFPKGQSLGTYRPAPPSAGVPSGCG